MNAPDSGDVPPADLALAEILWDWQAAHEEPAPADAALGLGSYDIRVADRGVELFRAGLVRLVCFSGASGNFTEGRFPHGEARAFAERLLLPTTTDVDRLGLAFRAATARQPDEGELRLLTTALTTHRGRFQRDPEAAHRVITNGESKPSDRLLAPEFAAGTMVANLVLKLDETGTRN